MFFDANIKVPKKQEKSCILNPDAKRLYDDLITQNNKVVRPVMNETEAVNVRIKLKLSQLIEVRKKQTLI
ncbi:acetylcholine receptor subunit alpha-like protein [Leptotrombidium deliense]|uniref:Acetylcholine receptor subunit alpha-like protein n=1 Tax=Leptotrombidium deliense TaxID=299467 RepID=A0A443SE18_9ACAR|nr:acetylcholine receptor subunit alpha-like protein [Leptotrombidium deliense]